MDKEISQVNKSFNGRLEELTWIILLKLMKLMKKTQTSCTEDLFSDIEKKRSDHDLNLCWWNICGVVMRDGYDSAKEYVDKVKLG